MALTIRNPEAEKKLRKLARSTGFPDTSPAKLAGAALEVIGDMTPDQYRDFIARREPLKTVPA